MDLASEIESNVTAALVEDVGSGDLTAGLIPADARARATVVSREAAVLCGAAWFEACFRRLDPAIRIEWTAKDGDALSASQTLCRIEGRARAMLTAERPALNFLQMLSAIATRTRQFVDAVQGTRAAIVDTRKTLPGLRLAEKYAVRCGGGENHRMGLYDGILIKENHIMAAGGITPAFRQAQRIAPPGTMIQVEVENLAELQEALAAGVSLILLDNFAREAMREAVRVTAGRAVLEASGGVNLDSVRAIAETGVDRISVGSLTKDIRAVDLSMRFETC
ncbi:MAG: carboxylating nicotinate-nucleotide diphosphorylase [Betaproteobacteria bacterium]|nr:carboxylating nicotinate-nucleotide diphosphorylase [Betaproteobacteria bacterium]